MTDSVSFAKVTRPRIRNPVPRPRLFNMLDDCRDYPVIWLSAPAGSGKTTLAASFLDNKKIKALWYQMDEGDRDPASFFFYMGRAARKAAPRRKSSLPLFTPEYRLGITIFTRRYFEQLYDRLKPPYVIVLDNYQLVDEASSLHERLSQGLEMVPEGINVLILSRKEPPAAFTRLRANRQIHVLASDSINFTLEESKTFFNQGQRVELPEAAIAKFHNLTQGWAAGLSLFLESLRIKGTNPQSSMPFSREEIFNYFAREIFEHLDTDTRHILLKTAFLPKMTGGMAQELTGRDLAGDVLARLSRSHFFTQRDAQVDPWYQYHPLFREYLLSRAKAEWSKANLQAISAAAAAILKNAGQIEDAAELILAAENFNRITDLILAHGSQFIFQGRENIILGWIDRLPPQFFNTTPVLLHWQGMALAVNHADAARQPLERALALFSAQGDKVGEILTTAEMLHIAVGNLTDFSAVPRWIEKVEFLLKEAPPFLLPEMEWYIAVNMCYAIGWCQPHRTDAIKTWINKGVAFARAAGDADRELAILIFAIVFFGSKDNYGNLALYLPRARQLSRMRLTSSSTKITWTCAEMWMKASQNLGSEEILQSAQQGLDMGRETGNRNLDHFILYNAIYACVRSGDLSPVADLLDRLEQVTNPQSNRQITQHRIACAWYYLLLGKIPEAIPIARLIPDQHPGWDPMMHIQACYVKFQIFWAANDRSAAVHQLEILKKITSVFDNKSLAAFKTNLIETQFRLESGTLKKGLASLATMLSMAKECNFDAQFNTFPREVMVRFCVTALNQEIEINYVLRLIRKLKLRPQTPPLETPHWPWPIRIATLGRFELLIDDEPVAMTRMKKTPLLLLKAIIAMGGENVRIDTLSEWLWPDAEGDAAYNAFRTTLSRLRRLLKFENVILSYEGAVSLDAGSVWVDTWAFERIRSTADSSRQDLGELFHQIRQLYQGEFLPRENDFWMISPRERLRDQYMRLVVRLGEAFEKQNRWQEAVACYRACLDADDLPEQIYQRLMTCYWRLGDKSAAASTYARLRKTLKSQLDVEPSTSTDVLYQRIVVEP